MSAFASSLLGIENKVDFDSGFRIKQHNEEWDFDGKAVRFRWRGHTEKGACSVTDMFTHLLGAKTNPADLTTETELALHKVEHCWWPGDTNETLHDFTVRFRCDKTGIDGRIIVRRLNAEIAWAKSLTESPWGGDIHDADNKFTSVGAEDFTLLVGPMWTNDDFRDGGWRVKHETD